MPSRPRDAAALFAEAQSAETSGDLERAAERYRELVTLHPDHSSAWFNLGLVEKQRRGWPAMQRAYTAYTQLEAKDEAGWWNLATAATALGDWDSARAAWKAFGVKLKSTHGPIDEPLGLTPVRINPATDAEVVWGTRLCPVRARLDNIPLPTSGHRYGDIVLHDGEPRGERVFNDQTYAVLDELIRLVPSTHRTWVAELVAPTPEHLAALTEALRAAEFPCEDWSNIRMLCKECSEGRPHPHDDERGVSWNPHRKLSLAMPSTAVARAILRNWTKQHPERRAEDPRPAEPAEA